MTEGDGDQGRDQPDCSAASLFVAIWETLSDIMGSAATATLLKRAIKHAATKQVDLEGLTVSRGQFTYEYKLPASWTEDSARPRQALQQLVWALSPLLRELTGPVVHHRLETIPHFEACGLSLEVTR